MKKFLIRLSFLVIPSFLVLGLVEVKLRAIPNDYSEKRKYLDKHAHDIENLILGSSLSWAGLNPAKIQGHTYNASFNGQTLEYDYYILNKFKTQFTSLEKVILTVFYPALEYKMSEVASNREVYYSVYFDKFPSKLLFPRYNGVQIAQQFLTDYRNPGAFIKSDSLGFSPKKRNTPENQIQHAQRLAKYHTRKSENNRIRNSAYLKNIALTCQYMNADLHIILHPAMQSYRDYIDFEQLNFLVETCENVSEMEDVHFTNLFADNRFEDIHYEDGIHLNEEGAGLLSGIVNELIQ